MTQENNSPAVATALAPPGDPYLRRGWAVLFGGWACALVPILGVPLLMVCILVAVIHAIIALAKNENGGKATMLLVAAIVSAPLVGMANILLTVLLGFGSFLSIATAVG